MWLEQGTILLLLNSGTSLFSLWTVKKTIKTNNNGSSVLRSSSLSIYNYGKRRFREVENLGRLRLE